MVLFFQEKDDLKHALDLSKGVRGQSPRKQSLDLNPKKIKKFEKRYCKREKSVIYYDMVGMVE